VNRDDRELLLLLTSWALLPILSWAALVIDERRLSSAQLARAWPPATRSLAVLWFGPLAVVLHFARTRGSFGELVEVGRKALGFALGLGVAALLVAIATVVLEALAALLGI
jgi:hypothetical protein